jgi:ribosomal protein S18 acetylase RimI-like enzyme
MDQDVRFALRDDLDPLASTLADAFSDDPMVAWMYPDPEQRHAQTEAFMRAGLDIGYPHGHVYSAAKNGAAAIWAPPEVDIFDERSAELADGLLRISAEHPHDEPHFYLFILGTAAASQSRGLGSALITDMLDRCDRQGLGAYLESSNIRNVPFYERHGFKVLSEIKISDDFTARPMWRDSRP